MKPTGHTATMLRCMLVLPTIFQVAAVQSRSGGVPSNSHKLHKRFLAVGASKLPPEAAPSYASQTTPLETIHTRNLAKGLASEATRSLPVPTYLCFIMCFQFVVVHTALAVCRSYHELTSTITGRIEAALRAASQTLTYGPMLCVLFVACRMHVEYLSDGREEPPVWIQNCMYALTFAALASTLLVLMIQLVSGKTFRVPESPFSIEKCQEELIAGGCKSAFYSLTIARYLIFFIMYGGLLGVIVGTYTYVPLAPQTSSDANGLAPAVSCTMILAIAFFSTQFVIAACRTFCELTRVDFPKCVGMMHGAATIVEFAPVLAVLFLVTRMRASQHDAQPEEWVQSCMFAATSAFCSTILLAMIVPLILCGTVKKHPWTHQTFIEVPKSLLGYIFVALRYLCMLGFYGGAAGVMVSIFVFESPGPMATLPVSSAAQCVVNLTCQFFFVYFLVTLMLTATEITGGTVHIEKWSFFPPIESARSTLALAPMLSIIFLTTRLNALLVTANKGEPASWVQDGMYLATWSLQMCGLMCLTAGLFMARAGTDYDGNIVYKFSNWYIGAIVIAIRYVSMVLLYGGMVMVIVGLLTMTPESAGGLG